MSESCLSLKNGAANTQTPVDEQAEFLQIQEIISEPTHEPSRSDPFSRHFSPELISHIFTIYTEDVNSSLDTVRSGGPLLLGAVSQLWRDVAFCMPQLWSTINIHIFYQSRPIDINKINRKIELVKQWLDRSRQLLLHITLRVAPVKHSWGPIFSLLRNYVPRWHTLVLDTSSQLYSAFTDGLICAPHLHTLQLIDISKFPPSEAESSDDPLDPFHLDTPSLKHLVIIAVCISSLAVDWANVTHFETDNLNIDAFFEILRLARRLTTYMLYGIHGDRRLFPIPTMPLMHSALRQLRLPSGMEGFFDLLILPSLKEFEYPCHKISRFRLHSLISLLRRSQCQLTHFDLSGNPNPDDLILLFSEMPTLTHVRLEDFTGCSDGIMDALLQKLTPIEGTPAVILPCLQSLEYCGEQNFSWSSLAAFIIARLELPEGNSGSDSPITDKTDVDRNLPIFRRNKNSIRLVSFKMRSFKEDIDLDTRARINCARNAGVSIKIVDKDLQKVLV